MRMTWFPMGYDRLEALEQSLGVMMRFVVGHKGLVAVLGNQCALFCKDACGLEIRQSILLSQ